MAEDTCVLCALGDSENGRYVWEDDQWRLWTRTTGPVPGYSCVNSRRPIPYITDLDGPEAASLGAVLARCAWTIREASGAELRADTASYVDLYLDLAYERQDWLLLDDDELVAASAADAEQAREAIEQVRRLIAAGSPLFDPTSKMWRVGLRSTGDARKGRRDHTR